MERIHVTVRARPLSLEDAKTSPWRISGNSVFIPNHSTKFEFDRVFGEDCKTLDVYSSRTKDIVAAAVHGFNGTVFAYGQTSSGKTHTMRGSDSEPGVIPLAVHDLFDIIQEEVDREFLLRMSYMEIYNEDVNDLLAPEHRKLQIHESIERGIFVAGLREEIVASPQQVLDLMQFGESHRHIGQTNMNLYSSRSHTIFRMIIESRDRSEDGSSCDAVRVSVLNLVDLAGSERAAKTGAEGVRLKEGSHINKSLMTLGTVIKKLSEGADIQGGHVPYRDSKLTRILQPSLGGNANTAIICNITLAQIHADETKSSLQFASRALRVTNCATVNEILTDAALLKRQKKEIEELRAKLQGSHSEHLEEEILTLRNTLLQSELERERITLELEEEKRAQAERERILKEQAKKIENLSSMVLYSNRDETRDQYKKGKRRDTWCPSNVSRDVDQKMDINIQSRPSEFESMKTSREVGPLLPFKTLVSELRDPDEFSKKLHVCKNSLSEDLPLPDPCALLHVTNRRKMPSKKKVSSMEEKRISEIEAEYEELLLKFETQRTLSEVQIDCLRRQLACSDAHCNNFNSHDHKIINHRDKNVSLRESEAILVIKQLQEKITVLEMEKASSQQNLDSIVELATEQRVCASEKLEEISKELYDAREDARIAHEELASNLSKIDLEVNFDAMTKPIMEIEEIMLEVYSTMTSLFHDISQLFPDMSSILRDFKGLMHQISQEQESIICNHNTMHSCMRQKIENLENEKLIMYNQSVDFQKQIEELRENVKKYEESLRLLPEEWNLEKAEYLSEIEVLQGELLSLSSCSLAKEKESLRKDLEKTKVKLKDTDSKLKNVMQEKTKLEGEKAFAEREVKRLQSEKSLLERNISKCDSLIGRRNESVVKKSSKCLDTKKEMDLAASYEQMQEDYKNLEGLAFEMEGKIASLEEELLASEQEREEAISRNGSLALEIEAMSEKMRETNAELSIMQEEISTLRLQLEEATSNQEKMETLVKLFGEEKELLAMQLSDSLLEMEEEKAVWLAKEKASFEAIEKKSKSYNSEIASLSQVILEVRSELECQKKECEDLREVLTLREESSESKKKCSLCQSLNTQQLKNGLEKADLETNSSHELSELKLRIEELKENISIMEVQMQKDGLKNNKDKAKDRMRLRGMQARLDAYHLRHTELANEMDIMNKKYEEASRKLKDKLTTYGIEVLNLKKQLSRCQCRGESSK